MTPTDLCFLTLSELSDLIGRKEVSPVEATRAVLDRIQALDGKLHSYVTVLPEAALEQARVAEQAIMRGESRGSLHGVPVAVKDIIQTAGVRTTCASRVRADWVPEGNATAAGRLIGNGGILVGKLNTFEFAMAGYHPDLPVPVNPWDAAYWAGGSSSGSGVALAAGLAFAALGTDTGGSIRFPSAACGVVGLKPTYGRVSRHGVFPLAESLDHVGPMARSVADVALLLTMLAGFDSRDPTSRRESITNYRFTLERGIKDVRIGLDEDYLRNGVHPEIILAVRAAARVLRERGATVKDVSLPSLDQVAEAWLVIVGSEAASAHESTFPSRADDYGPAARSVLRYGATLRGSDYARAHATREAYRLALEEIFQNVDLLLCPASPVLMTTDEFPPYAELDLARVPALIRHTAPFNLTGSPAISVPCGFSEAGLPLGMQLIGRHLEEGLLLRAAYDYEKATEWHTRRPPVAAAAGGGGSEK